MKKSTQTSSKGSNFFEDVEDEEDFFLDFDDFLRKMTMDQTITKPPFSSSKNHRETNKNTARGVFFLFLSDDVDEEEDDDFLDFFGTSFGTFLRDTFINRCEIGLERYHHAARQHFCSCFWLRILHRQLLTRCCCLFSDWRPHQQVETNEISRLPLQPVESSLAVSTCVCTWTGDLNKMEMQGARPGETNVCHHCSYMYVIKNRFKIPLQLKIHLLEKMFFFNIHLSKILRKNPSLFNLPRVSSFFKKKNIQKFHGKGWNIPHTQSSENPPSEKLPLDKRSELPRGCSSKGSVNFVTIGPRVASSQMPPIILPAKSRKRLNHKNHQIP